MNDALFAIDDSFWVEHGSILDRMTPPTLDEWTVAIEALRASEQAALDISVQVLKDAPYGVQRKYEDDVDADDQVVASAARSPIYSDVEYALTSCYKPSLGRWPKT